MTESSGAADPDVLLARLGREYPGYRIWRESLTGYQPPRWVAQAVSAAGTLWAIVTTDAARLEREPAASGSR